MSEFRCPVVEIKGWGKHPNADTLSITQIEGSTVIFKAGSYSKGDKVVYIPADSVVPLDKEYFSWLKDPNKPDQKLYRVKPKRLRKVFSEGFLVPLSDVIVEEEPHTPYDEVKVGTDFQMIMGVTKYEEPIPTALQGTQEKDPCCSPVYDIESFYRHRDVLQPGEEVVITEKLHGCNARFVYKDGKFFVGSHRVFQRDPEKARSSPRFNPNTPWYKKLWLHCLGLLGKLPSGPVTPWWQVAKQYKLEEAMKNLPGSVLYGEVYGSIQDLKYGTEPGEYRFAAFDIYDYREHRWLNRDEMAFICLQHDIPLVPLLYQGPFAETLVDLYVSGKSTLAGHMREGVVIKPSVERRTPELERVILKAVSEEYKLREKGSELH